MENQVEKKNNETKKAKRKNHSLRGAVIGLSIATAILGATSLGFGIAYGVVQSKVNEYSMQLEAGYKRNYYDLVDNVNNADMKISKLLASSNDDYQAKMLGEISEAAKDMQTNIASLPLTSDNIVTSVRFINQLSGYTSVLEEKIAKGDTLSDNDKKTLNELHESLTEMKAYLNEMSKKINSGYSILEASSKMNGEYDDFSLDFSGIKSDDTDYPSMIYDGPFSDSVVNQKVVGLSGVEISKEDAYKKVDTSFKNISNLVYEGETNGKFNTYNYSMQNSDGQTLYIQVTKQGGNILTVNGNVESDKQNIDMAQAEKIALDFVKNNGIKNAGVVWFEELDSQIYFNITPKQDGVILYPDLVKVKVDLEHGIVIGYDAISYFTNHTMRNLGNADLSAEYVKKNIDNSFNIIGTRLVLAPLDYNRQVLCHEFVCERNGATYYFYFNAHNGKQENILKVVETEDSSKLM